MKLKYAAIGMAALFCSAAQAQSSVTLYGMIDAGIGYVDNGPGQRTVRFMSGNYYGDRWGLTGKEDLGGGWTARFVLESGFMVGTGQMTTTGGFNRRSTVGVVSPYGALDFGRDYNPAFISVLRLDPFVNGTMANAASVFATAGSGSNNAIFYTTPNWNGFYGRFMYAFGESVTGPYSNGNRFGGSLYYNSGPLFLTASYAQLKVAPAGSTSTRNDTQWLVGGTYGFGRVRLHVAYQSGHNFSGSTAYNSTQNPPVAPGVAIPDSSSFANWLFGTTIQFGPAGWLAASAVVYDDRTSASRDAYQFGIGYFYPLSKRTTLYANAAKLINRNGQRFALTDAGRTSYSYSYDTATPTINPLGVAVGIWHTF